MIHEGELNFKKSFKKGYKIEIHLKVLTKTVAYLVAYTVCVCSKRKRMKLMEHVLLGVLGVFIELADSCISYSLYCIHIRQVASVHPLCLYLGSLLYLAGAVLHSLRAGLVPPLSIVLSGRYSPSLKHRERDRPTFMLFQGPLLVCHLPGVMKQLLGSVAVRYR